LLLLLVEGSNVVAFIKVRCATPSPTTDRRPIPQATWRQLLLLLLLPVLVLPCFSTFTATAAAATAAAAAAAFLLP
jgi:hypothetical protein